MTVVTALLLGVVLVCLVLLYVVYDGYLRLLQVWRALARPVAPTYPPIADPPGITVVIAVFNEARQLAARIQNLLDQDYPAAALDIVVASDGSTDDPAGVVAQFGGRARMVSSDGRVGKTAVQNQAVASSSSPILMFTDASTRCDPGFLRAIAAPFADAEVGAVQGHLLFAAHDAESPLASQGRYWRKELKIRQLESDLGVLAVSSGACIASRRDLWRPIDPTIGEDCVLPLDVVLQGKRIRYANAAVATEPAPDDIEELISTRARMTLRNWQGTWSRPTLLNPLQHPGYAFALWCHKLLRWLSPVFLILLTVAALLLPLSGAGPAMWVPGLAVLGFYVCGGIGWVGAVRRRHIPVCTAIYVFLLANAGFFVGLIRAARGETISRYR